MKKGVLKQSDIAAKLKIRRSSVTDIVKQRSSAKTNMAKTLI